jgi:hypothetical protein
MRIAAGVIAALMAAAVILGFDFHHGVNITETFFEPFH